VEHGKIWVRMTNIEETLARAHALLPAKTVKKLNAPVKTSTPIPRVSDIYRVLVRRTRCYQWLSNLTEKESNSVTLKHWYPVDVYNTEPRVIEVYHNHPFGTACAAPNLCFDETFKLTGAENPDFVRVYNLMMEKRNSVSEEAL
jgi:hypothetical protein